MKPILRFRREPSYVLTWDVLEPAIRNIPDGEGHYDSTHCHVYAGELRYVRDRGVWVFFSSDGSIEWSLHAHVGEAKAMLRKRYRAAAR